MFKLHFKPSIIALQVAEPDAKEHSDIKPNPSREIVLVEFLVNFLKTKSILLYLSWISQSLPLKLTVAPLFPPVLSRKKVVALLGANGPLAGITNQLRQEIVFGNSAKLRDLGAASLPKDLDESFSKRTR